MDFGRQTVELCWAVKHYKVETILVDLFLKNKDYWLTVSIIGTVIYESSMLYVCWVEAHIYVSLAPAAFEHSQPM